MALIRGRWWWWWKAEKMKFSRNDLPFVKWRNTPPSSAFVVPWGIHFHLQPVCYSKQYWGSIFCWATSSVPHSLFLASSWSWMSWEGLISKFEQFCWAQCINFVGCWSVHYRHTVYMLFVDRMFDDCDCTWVKMIVNTGVSKVDV